MSHQLSSHWHESAVALSADLHFDTFADVQAFVTALMALAVDLDHHPDVKFGYNRVHVLWTTHDAAGLSAKDWQAAARTDALIKGLR